jgi:signal transduction histidine kinase
LHIAFQDNGKGFDQTQVRNDAKGLGLRSMETRIEALGGTLDITTHPNQGFHAKLFLPL